MKSLVTGSAGFIGSHVVRALLEAGHEVRAAHLPREDLRNLAALKASPLGGGLELAPGDVTDLARTRALCRGVDRVFHLAAIYALWLPRPERLFEVNVEGTEKVLRAAGEAGVRRIVHTSSIAVFGGQGPGRDATEESPFRLGATGDLYSISKWGAHQVALREAARGLPVTIVAPCGPIGPGDVGPTPTGRLLLEAASAPALPLIDSETCFADVRDMAEAHLAAAERGEIGESYLLGTENLSMGQLAEHVFALLGRRRPILRPPRLLLRAAGRAALALAERTGRPPLITPAALRIADLGLRARCDKAREALGLGQRPLREAVRDALRWWAKQGYVRNPEARRRILKD